MTGEGRNAAGIACVVASALAFGAMAIFARVAYASGVDTVTLLALRFTIAAAAMLAVARARGAALPRGATLLAVAAMGAIGYGGQAFSFFTALTLAPAGLVALILYFHPALVAVLSAALLREPLTRVKVAALALSLAGVAMTVVPALSGGFAAKSIAAGAACALAAATFYAFYIVAGARVSRQVAALPMATVVIAAAALVFDAAALLRGPQWPQTTTGWGAIVAIALVSTVAAITLFFAGLARIGPTRASTLSTVEPLFTVVLAAFVLGETIAAVQLAGGALILAAVILLARAPTTGAPTA